ncbi:MAG: sigma-70 family RNA polymerase sigma factor [Prevotellaceae bacterium]|jgi:RNA polymerase sigma factor (sigma-70 family)|nr:sigma-70 family RNA polymerase sigma factor [Prevotellaceae bacterium]
MPEASSHQLEKLVAAYQPQLKSFIRQRVKSKEDAEDILQDVFYQLAKATGSALNPIEQVSAWLYRVARNAIINKGLKKREAALPTYYDDDRDEDVLKDFSEILFSDETSAPSPETEYLRSLVWTTLEAALAELPPEQRKVFELSELDGIPVKEISKATGVAVSTLLSRKHYAVLHLRKRMGQLHDEILYA